MGEIIHTDQIFTADGFGVLMEFWMTLAELAVFDDVFSPLLLLNTYTPPILVAPNADPC